MASVSAQNVTVRPARAGPSQNWRPAANMFPDGGTTRSKATGPCFHGLANGNGDGPAGVDASPMSTVDDPGSVGGCGVAGGSVCDVVAGSVRGAAEAVRNPAQPRHSGPARYAHSAATPRPARRRG